MSKRLYQLIAVATLVAAPVIVHLVSQAVPGAQPPAHDESEERDGPGHDEIAATQPQPLRPPPPPPPQSAIQPGSDPAMTVAPSLDVQGIEPTGIDLASDAPPPPPPRSTQVAEDDNVGAPPPWQSAPMDR